MKRVRKDSATSAALEGEPRDVVKVVEFETLCRDEDAWGEKEESERVVRGFDIGRGSVTRIFLSGVI